MWAKYIKHYWPNIFLVLLVVFLFFANYKNGTFLTGWDNLHPEFNFSANIKRSIFAVWQEYQGLGLLGGMGHAADLVHQLILLVFSTFIPQQMLRYLWTFLMFFLGGLGSYFILKNLLKIPKSLALLGGIFYLLNLSTIQAFYAPFETFTAHFAALPWLIFSLISYLQNPTRKKLLFFTLISFLTTPQSYVPTLFLVYLMISFIVLITFAFYNPVKKSAKILLNVSLVTFIVNAFWLLPFLYFTFTNSQANLLAKINQMANPNIVLQNKEFGDIGSAILLKGFYFNNVDPNEAGNITYMLNPLRTWINNPIITSLGYLFFAVIIIGVLSSFLGIIRNRFVNPAKHFLMAFILVFLFLFAMLTINTPPFSWINTLFRKIPLFNEVFRFSFTKFSIGASLFYAIFFVKGTEYMLNYLKRISRHFSYINPAIFIIITSLLITFTLPVFQGHLFYSKERIKIPQEYFDLFNFFKKQNPNTRIANFPQNSFWGWTFYKWGYGGSGFLWYGIEQPILDRAFDPWSSDNENYYWELSNAVYSKNANHFEEILNKYHISWLVLDENVYSINSSKVVFFPELKKMINEISSVEKNSQFGKITIYKVDLKDQPNDFVYLTAKLPSINSYNWGNQDQAYSDHGNYISVAGQSPLLTYFYPFRTLFTNKMQENKEFEITENEDSISLTKRISVNSLKNLEIPSYFSHENLIAANIYTKKDTDNLTVFLKMQTPQIFINDQKIWGETIDFPLFTFSQKAVYPFDLNLNGFFKFPIENKEISSPTTFLSLKNDNLITITNDSDQQTQRIKPDFFSKLNLNKKTITINQDKDFKLNISIPKIQNDYLSFNSDLSKNNVYGLSCDKFRKGDAYTYLSSKTEGLIFYSKNATFCSNFYLPFLDHKEAYSVFIKSKNLKGRSLHFWINNTKEEWTPIDTYLPTGKNEVQSSFVLSPQELFGTSYSLNFDNISIGKDEAINILNKVSVYPLPYNFLMSIILSSSQSASASTIPTMQSSITVSHPNQSLYIVKNGSAENNLAKTIVLSQTFSKGWKAYEITNGKWQMANWVKENLPFLFGKELKNHVLVNNWANGWVLENSQFSSLTSHFVIIFWPQYLEYLGFILLIGSFTWLLLTSRKKHPYQT